MPLPLFSEFVDPAAYPLYLPHGHVDFKNDTIALISKPVKGENEENKSITKTGKYKEWNAAEVEQWRAAGWLDNDDEEEEEEEERADEQQDEEDHEGG